MNKLFLLDAMALIYRGHYAFAKNPRVTSKGLNTGAILGFINTLVEVLDKEKPTHIAVAFDTPEPTFRHQNFEAYKAQRQQQPEDISLAIPYITQLLQAFQIPILALAGYEADDVIGTISKQVAQQHPDTQVFMMTMDKDYGQLVSENVFLYKPSYLGNEVEILGIPEILAKWEIQQISQVTDILGLQGDAVDNIPGIPGIGEKTAKKLIQEFGSVENLIQNVAQLKGKIQENVQKFAEQGLLSKQLATIDTQVPLQFSLSDFLYRGFDAAKLKPLLEDLEFRTLAKRLLKEKDKPTPPTPTSAVSPANASKNDSTDLFGQATTPKSLPLTKESKKNNTPAIALATTEPASATAGTAWRNIHNTFHEYYLIETAEERKLLVAQLAQLQAFCFDTETTSLDIAEADLVGIAFAWYPTEAYFVVASKTDTWQAILADFAPVWANENSLKIGQNLKYDIAVLKKYGVQIKGKLWDTMLAHYLLEPDMRHNMDILAQNYLQYQPIDIEQLIGKKGKNQGSMAEVAMPLLKEYACEDADITLQLYHALAPQIAKQGLEKLLFEVEIPLIDVLATMEHTGVSIDVPTLQEISQSLEQEIKSIEKSIYTLAGERFNIASPKQLGEILFEKLKLDSKAKKTKTGQYATGEEVLVKLATEHAIITQILEYRELQKLKNTYIDALPLLISPIDNRIHTSYNQAVAATGRLSSSNPNLQNIPIRTAKGREIRKAFVAQNPDFLILSADYSQIELRIMAVFSQDATMLQAFREGKDIHATTASRIYKVPIEQVTAEMRRKAKTANFGIIYGISAFGLAQRLNIPRREAADLIQAYWQEFPAIKAYMDNVVAQARQQEYVETLLGRRRYLRNINSGNAIERGMAERNAINAPIQGSAADMIKLAMIRIHHLLQKEALRSRMILQVHDELVFEVHTQELAYLKPLIIQAMQEALPLPIPLEVGIGVGKNWLEAH